MTLQEAVKKSLVERTDDWDVEGEDVIQVGSAEQARALVVLHRRTGLKVRAPLDTWRTQVQFWSPSAKMWWEEYDRGSASDSIAEAVRSLRRRKLGEDQCGDRLVPQLEGGNAKFTDDAKRLARAILDEDVSAAFGAADEILATMERPA